MNSRKAQSTRKDSEVWYDEIVVFNVLRHCADSDGQPLQRVFGSIGSNRRFAASHLPAEWSWLDGGPG